MSIQEGLCIRVSEEGGENMGIAAEAGAHWRNQAHVAASKLIRTGCDSSSRLPLSKLP